MGPIQSVGIGKAVPAARCVPEVYYLLPACSDLSSSWQQSAEHSAAVASDACIGATTGTSTGDASDAGAQTEHRHTT